MALITDLPTNASPATSDYMITDTGSATQKTTIANLKAAMGLVSEVDIATYALVSGTAKTFTVPNSSRYFVVISAASAARQAAYIVGTTTSGGVAITQIVQGSGITSSTSTNTLTLTANGAGAIVAVFTLNGSPMS